MSDPMIMDSDRTAKDLLERIAELSEGVMNDHGDGWRRLLAACYREIVTLKNIIDLLTDSSDCQLDHHGNCKMHGSLMQPCPHKRAKVVLDAYRPTK